MGGVAEAVAQLAAENKAFAVGGAGGFEVAEVGLDLAHVVERYGEVAQGLGVSRYIVRLKPSRKQTHFGFDSLTCHRQGLVGNVAGCFQTATLQRGIKRGKPIPQVQTLGVLV